MSPANEAAAHGAKVRELQKQIDELESDNEELFRINEKLERLLTATANALKGAPGPRALHSWHDLPEIAAKAIEKAAREKARRDLAQRDRNDYELKLEAALREIERLKAEIAAMPVPCVGCFRSAP